MSGSTTRTLTLLLCWMLSQWGPAVAVHAAGAPSGGAQADGGGSPPRPDQIAADHFRDGLRARDAAWRYEERARDAKEPDAADRFHGKARGRYEVAIESQRKALALAPDMHQAHTSLGYALRRTGRYDEAIASYDRALELEPQYGEAVEYRAEAYLQLGRLQDVQRAWNQLEEVPELAAQLRTAMDAWVAARRTEPAGLDPTKIEEFASWLADQEGPADPATTANERGRW